MHQNEYKLFSELVSDVMLPTQCYKYISRTSLMDSSHKRMMPKLVYTGQVLTDFSSMSKLYQTKADL